MFNRSQKKFDTSLLVAVECKYIHNNIKRDTKTRRPTQKKVTPKLKNE